MPRDRIAVGITVMVVHGRAASGGPAPPAGRLGGERGTARPANGPVTGLTHNRLGSCLSNGPAQAAQLAPCYQGVRPMT